MNENTDELKLAFQVTMDQDNQPEFVIIHNFPNDMDEWGFVNLVRQKRDDPEVEEEGDGVNEQWLEAAIDAAIKELNIKYNLAMTRSEDAPYYISPGDVHNFFEGI